MTQFNKQSRGDNKVPKKQQLRRSNATKKEPSKESSSDENPNRKSNLHDWFIVVFGVSFVLSCSLNFLHLAGYVDTGDDTRMTKTKSSLTKFQQGPTTQAMHKAMQEFKQKNPFKGKNKNKQNSNTNKNENKNGWIFPELNCQAYGGPSIEDAQEMVYWQDIPSDTNYLSPFAPMANGNDNSDPKFLTFEPDGGGWNNIRMAMESVIGLAIAMGRILVMPPQKRMYLLGRGTKNDQKHFSFADFFPIHEIAQEHSGNGKGYGSGAFQVMTMKEYLETQAMTGKLKNKITGKVEFPPGNRTEWDGIDNKEYDILREYLRNVTYTPIWNPGACLPAFPSSGDHKDVKYLQNLAVQARQLQKLPDSHHQPINVTTENVLERLEDSLAGRTKLCVYDEELQAQPGLHFQCNHQLKVRMLVHFYAFLFFEDWKEDLWMKRFIRDHVRYIDEIQCAAARVVAKIRHRVKQQNRNDRIGIYNSMHIRRGDFQFKATRIPAEEIVENIRENMPEKTTIFIATDERDKNFFQPLRDAGYELLFLDDFKEELSGVNPNYFGMIDQLVASKGRIFFGCWFSTFTGYIIRLRGYHSQIEQSTGWEDGVLPNTYYYATKDRLLTMHHYSPLKGGFFNREFPTSWRQLNQGIGQL